jgi:hypothetical protein
VDPWATLGERLRRLLPPSQFAPGRDQETYYYELSLLLREALELKTAVRATDLTLGELRGPLRRHLQPSSFPVEDLLHFLERADMIKFAGVTSTREEALLEHQRVTQWVDDLRPRPEVTLSAPSADIFVQDAKGGRS